MRSDDFMITELDSVRLSRLIGPPGPCLPPASRTLDEFALRLDTAAVVSAREIAPDVVTMNSRVMLEERPSGTRRVVTLVYPHEGAPDDNRISVLSPLGQALLGARLGEEIGLALPAGGHRRWLIVEMLYQPEAAGRYDL